MRKFLSFLSLMACLQLLMLVGLIGYVVASGRLDKEKATTIVSLLRHPGTPDGLRDAVDTLMEPQPAAATAPATQQAPEAGSSAASAADRIAYARDAVEKLRLQLDQQQQELLHRQELLDQQRWALDARFAELSARTKSFNEQAAATQRAAADQDFAKSLELYDQLKPRQIKEIFLGLSADVVTRYLKAMDSDRAGQIISQFKSPEEQRYIAVVLEKIRGDGTGAAIADGNSAATSSPPAGSSNGP